MEPLAQSRRDPARAREPRGRLPNVYAWCGPPAHGDLHKPGRVAAPCECPVFAEPQAATALGVQVEVNTHYEGGSIRERVDEEDAGSGKAQGVKARAGVPDQRDQTGEMTWA